MKYKFNVGDKVKVVLGGCGVAYHYVGCTAFIAARAVRHDGEPGYEVIKPNSLGSHSSVISERAFELAESAKPTLDLTKPVFTRAGRSVEIVTTTGRGKYPVLAYIGGSEAPVIYTLGGNYCIGASSNRDLTNIGPKKVFIQYANVYPCGSLCMYNSRSEADEGAGNSRIACIKVVATEGQYDD